MTWNPDDQDVVYPVDKPLRPTGGVVGLKGNLAPDGAIVKVAGMKNDQLVFEGPALVLRLRGRSFRRGAERAATRTATCIVIRYEGPRGGPGMREMLSTTAALYGQGMGSKVALITDGRFSGAHARLLRRPCRAGSGGRRPDRAAARRRHHPHRRDQSYDRGQTLRRGTRGAQEILEAAVNQLRLRCDLEICAAGGSGALWRRDAAGRRRRGRMLCR